MNIQTLIPQLSNIAVAALQVLGGVVILATIIARLTPTSKDDELVEEAGSILNKVIAFMPTLGMNPNTQKLQDALADAKAQLDAKKKAA